MPVSRRLPLFPLPLVLFPGAPLPLHIFEPRYRQLLTDCLAGDREFGIVYLPPHTAERALPPGHVGCVAHVHEAVPLEDGRSNVVVQGVDRFALDGYVDASAPYHVGEVRGYDDEPADAALLAATGTRVRELFLRVGRAARALADDSTALPPLPDDDARLSFAIASYVDLDAAARQRLLVSRSPVERLDELETLLARARGGLERRAAVHERAKSNGRGPHAAAE